MRRIILSGYAEVDYIMSAINEGSVDKYILKPWDNANLKEEIKKLLGDEGAIIDEDIFLKKDPVTKLMGLRLLKNTIRENLLNNPDVTNFYVLMISIPDLNSIIHIKGIQSGNQLLVQFSDFIKTLDDNILKARLNSRTFVLVCPNFTENKLETTKLNINNYIFNLNKQQVFDFLVKVDYGTSYYPGNFKSVEEVLNHAEAQVNPYKTNSSKDKKLCFSNDDSIVCFDGFELEKSLYNAISNKQIYICLQPIFSINNNSISSAESLARWNYNNNISVPPNVFIPISNSSSSIHELSLLVLEQSFSELKKINSEFIKRFKISINISPYFLMRDDFSSLLTDCADKYQLEYKNIQLEITEDIFVECNGSHIETINQLRAKGFLFAIDDFGSGYASFNYLKNFEIDSIKIDQMFVCDLDKNKNSRYLVAGIIKMAHSLGVSVVAEGIETQEQFDILTSLNCDYIQGYFIGKPILPGKFYNLLSKNKNKLG